ncbi:membrane protein [Streptomyces sp. MMG1533]|nr:membrane protein [Streptomyces sp. MMG1533]
MTKEIHVAKKKKLPFVYKPVGFVLGWTSGTLAGLAFQKTWKAIRHEDDAPDALDRDRGWGEILLAAAIQGAIFAVVRSAVDRTGAKAIERSTGVWPAGEKGGRD